MYEWALAENDRLIETTFHAYHEDLVEKAVHSFENIEPAESEKDSTSQASDSYDNGLPEDYSPKTP